MSTKTLTPGPGPLRLAYILMSRPISPKLFIFPNFEFGISLGTSFLTWVNNKTWADQIHVYIHLDKLTKILICFTRRLSFVN